MAKRKKLSYRSGALKGPALVAAAKRIAEAAHRGQYREDRRTPYITHPGEVVAANRGDYKTEAIGWLHDVLEHTRVGIQDLKKAGFPQDVIEDVCRLSHLSNISYQRYLAKVKRRARTRKIKIADMLSNLRETRNPADIFRYSKGLLYLFS
ncbi:MAG TPA: hypothetical protein VIM69_07335 [Opitutaceae bacterium]